MSLTERIYIRTWKSLFKQIYKPTTTNTVFLRYSYTSLQCLNNKKMIYPEISLEFILPMTWNVLKIPYISFKCQIPVIYI